MEYSALDIANESASLQGALAAGLDTTVQVTGIVSSLNPTTNRLLVSIYGSDPIPMEFASGSYTPGEMVDVARTYVGGVVKFFVRGRTGGTPAVTLPTVPPAASTTATATTVIVPQWSGTWRVARSAYDRWNESRSSYGGRSTLYQGDGYGSGQLFGLALYGDQIKNLGATTITAMTLTVRDAGLAIGSRPAMEIRAATNTDSSGIPSPTGVTMTAPALASGAVGAVAVDASLFDAFRTGAIKALTTVGVGSSKYNALRGTSDADGMALKITYTRPV